MGPELWFGGGGARGLQRSEGRARPPKDSQRSALPRGPTDKRGSAGRAIPTSLLTVSSVPRSSGQVSRALLVRGASQPEHFHSLPVLGKRFPNQQHCAQHKRHSWDHLRPSPCLHGPWAAVGGDRPQTGSTVLTGSEGRAEEARCPTGRFRNQLRHRKWAMGRGGGGGSSKGRETARALRATGEGLGATGGT